MTDSCYERILGAIDLDDDNDAVLNRLAQLARSTGASARLVYVLDPVPIELAATAAAGAMAPPSITAGLDAERLQAARNKLAALAQLDDLQLDHSITTGAVADTLLDLAREFDADLIVLGSHGRSGIGRVLGSTASAIVHRAECDVLTVRLLD